MEDGLLFLAVLLGVFLGEGIWLAPRGAWLLRRNLFGAWQAIQAHTLPLLNGIHLSLGGVVPHQLAVLAQSPTFLVVSEGVWGLHPGLPGPLPSGLEANRFYSWGQLKELYREERWLRLGPHRLARAVDEGTARRWCGFLRSLAGLTQEGRRLRIQEAWGAHWDVREAARRWRRFRRLNPPLIFMSWIQCLLVFMIFPALMISGWISVYWLPCVALLVVHQICLLILFGWIRSRVHPQGTKGLGRLAAMMFFSPPYLARAPEMLTIDLFEGIHPICVAWVLLDRAEFVRQAGSCLRALRNPLGWDDANLPSSVREEIARQEVDLVEWISARGVGLNEMEVELPGDGSLSYCPRCLSTFLRSGGECSDCRGVELISRTHVTQTVTQTGVP